MIASLIELLCDFRPPIWGSNSTQSSVLPAVAPILPEMPGFPALDDPRAGAPEVVGAHRDGEAVSPDQAVLARTARGVRGCTGD